jgi:hypothetical protein
VDLCMVCVRSVPNPAVAMLSVWPVLLCWQVGVLIDVLSRARTRPDTFVLTLADDVSLSESLVCYMITSV